MIQLRRNRRCSSQERLRLRSRAAQAHVRCTHRTAQTERGDLLALLVAARPDTVAKDEIVEKMWPHSEASDAALSQTVYRLRRALAEKDPSNTTSRRYGSVRRQFRHVYSQKSTSTTLPWRLAGVSGTLLIQPFPPLKFRIVLSNSRQSWSS
jgi:hypothetical protein